MKKFLFNITLMAFLVAGGMGVILYIPPVEKNFYAEILRKYDYLHQSGSPKIILIGGSNICYGVSARQLSEYYHLPAVNMGLNGGLGLRLMLSQVRPWIGKGDIIVISPEYEQFLEAYHLLDGQGSSLVEVLYYSPESLQYLESISQYKETIKYLPIFAQKRLGYLVNHRFGFRKKLPQDKEKLDYRQAFNAHGDATYHFNLPVPGFGKGNYPLPDNFDMAPARLLNQFAQEARLKGAEVYFAYPGYAQSEYNKNRKSIQHLESLLNRELDFKFLGKPNDYIFSDELFFDTVYHLGQKGTQLRTLRLRDNLESERGVFYQAQSANEKG